MTVIKIKNSNVAGRVPAAGDLEVAELGINLQDKKLYSKDAAGSIFEIGAAGDLPSGSIPPNSGNNVGDLFYNTKAGEEGLYYWDGSSWILVSSEPADGEGYVKVSGDTMTGALILPSGTAAAPALGVGSTDNGVYSPGTDQVAISTNGTGRLFVDGDGNVGVGMTPVDVAGFNSIQLADTNGTYLDFYTSATQQARIISLPNDLRINQITSGTLGLWTNNQERLRITSDGKVGVGTNSPVSPLEVNGGAKFGYTVASGPLANYISSSGGLYSYFSSTAGVINANTDNSNTPGTLIFSTGTERLRITSDGKVGIGTSLPAEKLHIEGAGTQTIRLRNSTPGSAASPQSTFIQFYGYQGNGGVEPRASIEAQDRRYTITGGYLNIATANTSNVLTNALHIDNQQRVGIGTTSPSQILSVGSTTGRIFTVNQGTANKTILDNDYALELRSNSGYQLIHNANNSVGSITFQINSGEKARIDSAGRLLVGTSTTSDTKAKLGVAGSVNIGAGSGNSVTLADGATGTVATPVRGYSYINISHSNTTADGLLLLVFANTNILTIVDTVHSNAGTRYSASVSGRNLQVTNNLGGTASFYASCMTLAWGNNG